MTSIFIATVLTVGFAANSFAQYTFYGDEEIIDGEFAGDSISSEWSTFVADWIPVTATFDASSGELAVTDITNTDGTTWHVQFNQVLTQEQINTLVEGATYELSFDARTDTDSTKVLQVYFGQNGGAFANYASADTLDGTMTTYVQEFVLPEVFDTTDSGMKLGFEMGTSNKSVYLDNISLKRKAESVVFNGGLNATPPDSGWIAEGSNGTVDFSDGEIAITGISGAESYSIQAYQNFNEEQLDSIYVGPYEIQFDARTDADEKTFVLFFGENIAGGGWTNFASTASPTVTSEMTTYTYTVDVTETWSSMKLGFEVGASDPSVYIDNVILKRVREVAPDAPTVSLTTSNGFVTVQVNAVEGAAMYDVFFADSAFTDTDGGSLVGTIDPANGLTLEHTTAAPHPSVAYDFMAHYGVVAKSAKGTASDMTAGSIETGMSTAENYAVELSNDGVNAVVNAFENGVIPEGATLASFFPDNYVPFTIEGDNGVPVVGADVPSDDLTSKHWIGYETNNNALIIYAEVVDDSVVYATEADGSGGAWNFDSWEMGIGNYTPNSFIEGSSHTTGIGGEEPDWQLRGGGLVDAAGDGSVRGFVHGNGYTDTRINGEVPNSQTLIEATDTGYRLLTIVNTINLVGDTQDKAFDFPTGSEVSLYPLQIAMNDNDAAARETQKAWGSKAVNGDWWQRPAQWNVVAFVGLDAIPTSNEELGADKPMKISLDQNYPNPFNPTTKINFTLPSASKVTLEVFNVLGQKVATLINNKALNSGAHSHAFDASNLSSGLYIYRLNVGSSFTSSKKMMLIK